MQVYDGKSSVKWFYDGLMTFEQMRADSRKKLLTEVPCVLIDDGQGTAYDYRTIQSMCAEYGVEYTGDSETDMAAISDKIANPDPTPDVLAYQAKQTADEAKAAAQTASETAATAQAAADKAKGAVADATSAAQTAAEAAATAQTTADEAKATAGTAAASMNEYLDALLGLDATDETGATDAE